MGCLEKKIDIYFMMPDKEPNMDSFLRIAHELFLLHVDDNNFQRVMILTPPQLSCFLSSVAQSGNFSVPSHANFHEWKFAGFLIRTLNGKIE